MPPKLKIHLDNVADIQNILRQLDVAFVLENGEEVETLLIYLSCPNGVCEHTELFRIIKDSILHKFVLAISEIERKLRIENTDQEKVQLFEKSVRKLSKHTAKGELGELLLFTLLEVYYDAPQILSKISLKTNPRMAVHGADAVHAQYKNNELKLYLGESKLHKKFNNAATDAVKSISNHLEKYKSEFDLLESHIDFPEMDDQIRDELIEILNPFSDFNDEILHTPCFIGFSNAKIFDDDENEYLEKYTDTACELIQSFYDMAYDEGLDNEKIVLLLLPFSSIDDLVAGFIEYMGIEE